MELSFNGGKLVSLNDELNYKEVIDDFPRAKTIRIITYNISKNQKSDKLLDAIKSSNADIQFITNVPSRMNEYFNTKAGEYMRATAQKNIQIYLSKLQPDNFPKGFVPFFNVNNHAKLIGTENIVYIGSANYSDESANNIEAGIIIEDKEFIQKLYTEFFDNVKDNSLSYFDENFSAFRLFVLSLYSKFNYHYKNLITNLYTNYERTKMVVANTIFIDKSDLEALYRDLDELDSVFMTADDTYDLENEDYNLALEQLKDIFSNLSVEWLKEVISPYGTLYKLVTFNTEEETNNILQEEYSSVAYDEYLDMYVDKAMDKAFEIYSFLHHDFDDEADDFLAEIEKILSALDRAISFTHKWKVVKINPNIDNTQF